MTIQSNQNGSTLISMMLALAILSIGLTEWMEANARIVNIRNAIEGKKNSHILENAFSHYVKTFGHLPCPADPYAGIESVNYGIGFGSGGSTTNCTSSNLFHSANNVVAGALPVGNLGINLHHINDAYGARYTYVVDEDMTMEGDASSGFSDTRMTSGNIGSYESDSNIYVMQDTGVHDYALKRMATADDVSVGVLESCDGSIVDSVNDCVPVPSSYVVISHGKNKHGARSRNGELVHSSQINSANEYANSMANASADFRTINAFHYSTNINQYFDDEIIHFSKALLR